MTAVADALAALVEAVGEVDGLGAYQGDARGRIQLPAATVGAPALAWQSYCDEPTEATFPVFVIVRLQEGAIEALLTVVPLVQEAIESSTPGRVTGATPTSFDLGNGQAAAYELSVLYPLSG